MSIESVEDLSIFLIDSSRQQLDLMALALENKLREIMALNDALVVSRGAEYIDGDKLVTIEWCVNRIKELLGELTT